MIPLLVDLETEWRGGQNQALLMLKGFYERGHAAELLAARGSALGSRASANGIGVHFVSRGGFRLPAARKIRELLSDGRIDVVHANESHGLTAAWLARAHQRVPLFVSRRVGYPLSQSGIAQARFRAAHKIIAISEWVAEQAAASGAPREKLAIVYEGVPLPALPTSEARRSARARWGITDDSPLLGCVGVLASDKGQQWLIEALPALRAEFPNCRLLLAGDGPARRDLEKQAKQLDAPDAVIFSGFVKEIESVYAALDIFLFPSMFEGLGTSLLSAMSYATPSIAFARCAFGEIIENERSGLLVESSSAPQIQQAAVRLLRDKSWAQNIGRAARQRIGEKFSADKMVDAMLRLYDQSLRS
ncbi:MAG TPA: glycosyltransferase family 4 protein [Candidatus Saccharimonadales bacterium]|nr:glycosyltransferase family 4 protein [Candidatus Saccharimonadales bacterium]